MKSHVRTGSQINPFPVFRILLSTRFLLLLPPTPLSQFSETASTHKHKRRKTELGRREKEKEEGEEQDCKEVDIPSNFYAKSAQYWSGVDATISGMLGGLSEVHAPDIAGSKSILDRFGPSLREYALDCGAGIGRITKDLLLPHFTTVDMVEMMEKFLDASTAYIGRPDVDRVGNKFCCALQHFTPPQGRYDVIWVQWVIGYLTLSATVEFLRRCVTGLRSCDCAATATAAVPTRRSVIVLKETVFWGAKSYYDKRDSSFMRTHDELLEVFRKAKLRVLLDEKQTNLPRHICPVYAFVLVPQDG
ncbi:unnamed protein product [Hydatigera taeniaeformis]|uniref:Alpha N-terminal protein methyltransferase 1 n=1 Tax=Hydatigena taeniaeformis TaxID=6205 RepID=A0A0R3X8H2_HYDTA|nr:unnamed protein product [Hydatigera taeniaeformis]